MDVTFPKIKYQKSIRRDMQSLIRVMAKRHKLPPCVVVRIDDQFFMLKDRGDGTFVGWGRTSKLYVGKEFNFIRLTDRADMCEFINQERGEAFVACSAHIKKWHFTIYGPGGKKVGETSAIAVAVADLLYWGGTPG